MKQYLTPRNDGLHSTPRHTGSRVAKLLNALDGIDYHLLTYDSRIINSVYKLSEEIKTRLRAEGWRITVKDNSNWQVLPPK